LENKIIDSLLFDAYLTSIPSTLKQSFDELKEAELSTKSFSFYASIASVYSSKIEGEQVELDSFIKYKRDGISFQPDYTKKTDDLYNAYLFAKSNNLNEASLKQAHKLLSQHLLTKDWQGKYRQQNMYVTTDDGRIEYVAALPNEVGGEMDKLLHDIEILKQKVMRIEEVFYYASMIHLVFVKIHPWIDGNGRTGRLLEKWFIAEKLGEKAWFLQSEKMYYLYNQTYFKNIRLLGLEYMNLNYANALPFLLLLPTYVFENKQ
jgi:Fic family protein